MGRRKPNLGPYLQRHAHRRHFRRRPHSRTWPKCAFVANLLHYKWGILSGVAYLTTGIIASGKLEKTIETHNAVISPTLSSTGLGLQLRF